MGFSKAPQVVLCSNWIALDSTGWEGCWVYSLTMEAVLRSVAMETRGNDLDNQGCAGDGCYRDGNSCYGNRLLLL